MYRDGRDVGLLGTAPKMGKLFQSYAVFKFEFVICAHTASLQQLSAIFFRNLYVKFTKPICCFRCL